MRAISTGYSDVFIDRSERTVVTIRRWHFYKDVLQKCGKLTKDELKKPLFIDFVGEDGSDFGELTH